jgi:hypothetical protein
MGLLEIYVGGLYNDVRLYRGVCLGLYREGVGLLEICVRIVYRCKDCTEKESV